MVYTTSSHFGFQASFLLDSVTKDGGYSVYIYGMGEDELQCKQNLLIEIYNVMQKLKKEVKELSKDLIETN